MELNVADIISGMTEKGHLWPVTWRANAFLAAVLKNIRIPNETRVAIDLHCDSWQGCRCPGTATGSRMDSFGPGRTLF